MFGYMGQILRVDLTKGRVSKEALKENDCKMFLGGSGLATRYLFDEVSLTRLDPRISLSS
jgi:aldehyde:ferredoxin oxidoreductase